MPPLADAPVDGLGVTTADGVLWVTLDRPSRGNSVTRRMQRGLVDALRTATGDPTTRAVVLTGAGDRHFCTGPDLSDPEMAPDPTRAPGDAARILREGSQAVVSAILDCEKPVVCALNGTAAGVGASMVLACDLVVAASTARIIEIFVKRGLAPDGGAAYLLARKLPMNVAKELLFFGRPLDAEHAHRIGLVNAVVEPEELHPFVAGWASELATGPTRAIAAAKALVNAAPDTDRSAAFFAESVVVEQVAGTDDVAEGVAAFLDRREPRFTGR
ncbi:enoyl-CoA hydratase-related protein [uncultured Williamsia sp.]|uniref:enoyl-CoA hydratase/isomerase family protein n=1 Tax=uncultured Williamsia sp. TaxID=259311 RepID=UPI00261B91DF|nr:enoyl-CoA hydratase-related protein [uncultured Williamsia sp.]